METQLITFETAKLAKKKGFLTNGTYDTCNGLLYHYNKDGILEHSYKDSSRVWGSFLINHPTLGAIFSNACEAPPQCLLQKWLREVHGISVLIVLDCTLSYVWNLTPLHPKASINEYYTSQNVWCGHYEEALEAGLIAALEKLPDYDKSKSDN